MAVVDVGLIFRVSGNMAAGMRKIRGQMDRTSKSGKRLGLTFKQLGAGFLGARGIAIAAEWAKSFVKMGSEMQNLRVRIGTFTRDSKLAEETFAKMKKQFRETPFDLQVLGDSMVRLKAAGVDPLDGSLKGIVDAVAAFGGGSQELRRATIAIQQMAGKGVISMEELRQQLGEAVPFAMKIMANQMKLSVAEFISEVERGNIEASVGIKAFTDGAARFFGGTADIMVNTMSGALERVKKAFQEAADVIFNDFNIGSQIAVILQRVAAKVDEFVASLSKEEVEEFFAALVSVASAIVEIGTVVGKVLAGIAVLISGFINNIPFGAEILVVGGLGIMGFLLFGGLPGAFVLAAIGAVGLAVSGINGAMDNLEKGEFQLGGVLGDLPGMEADAEGVIKIVKKTSTAVRTELALAGDVAKELITTFQEGLPELLNIETFTKTGQTAVAKLDRTLDSLQAKLKAAAGFPFEAQIEKLRIQALNLNEEMVKADLNVQKLRDGLAEAKVVGTAEEIALVAEVLEIAEGALVRVGTKIGELTKRTNELEQAGLDKIAEKITDRMKKLANTLEQRRAKISGSIFGGDKAIADIDTFHNNLQEKLKKDLELAEKINAVDGSRVAQIAQLNAALVESNVLRERELADAKKINAIKLETLRLEMQATNAQIARDLAGDKRELTSFQGPSIALFQPEEIERAREMREQIAQTTAELVIQIDAIKAGTDGRRELTASELEQIALLQARIGTMKLVAAEVTAAGIATRDMWMQVASTIKEGLTDALVGVITQTGTMKERINSMFASLTQAAARYIIKLLIIKALESSTGVGAAAGFAGFFAGGSAKGNAFTGSIKPFAKGGIIGGPTMFGLAGEAGPEAILPLKRGAGGRLGVSGAGGGGGGNMNLTIVAIDPQSGTQFVLDHIGDVNTGLRNERALGVAR